LTPRGRRTRRAQIRHIKMADLTLSDGREINYDLSKVTAGEYRNLFKDKQPIAYEDELISRAIGYTVEEYLALPLPDFKRVQKRFFKKVTEPIADPS
jgi:hypothetical protein